MKNPFKRHKRKNRARRGNPGLAGIKSRVTAGFNRTALTDGVIMAGGAFGNYYLRDMIASKLGFDRNGLPSYILGLTTAGAMLAVPSAGPKLFAGALAGEVARGLSQYVVPQVKLMGELITGSSMNELVYA